MCFVCALHVLQSFGCIHNVLQNEFMYSKCTHWARVLKHWLHPKCSLHVFGSYIARNLNHSLQCSQDVFGSFQSPLPPVTGTAELRSLSNDCAPNILTFN
jgi:hypothetical protein